MKDRERKRKEKRKEIQKKKKENKNIASFHQMFAILFPGPTLERGKREVREEATCFQQRKYRAARALVGGGHSGSLD